MQLMWTKSLQPFTFYIYISSFQMPLTPKVMWWHLKWCINNYMLYEIQLISPAHRLATQQVGYDQKWKSAVQRRKLQQHSQYHFRDGATCVQRHTRDDPDEFNEFTQGIIVSIIWQYVWKYGGRIIIIIIIHNWWCAVRQWKRINPHRILKKNLR